MKKRVLSSILAGVLAVSVFAGCGSKTRRQQSRQQQITAQHLQQKQPQKSLQKQQAAQ